MAKNKMYQTPSIQRKFNTIEDQEIKFNKSVKSGRVFCATIAARRRRKMKASQETIQPVQSVR